MSGLAPPAEPVVVRIELRRGRGKLMGSGTLVVGPGHRVEPAGEDAEAGVVVTVAPEDLRRHLAGDLPFDVGYMTGDIKVDAPTRRVLELIAVAGAPAWRSALAGLVET